MAKPIALKPEEEFARSYVDRLILEQLTEMEAVVKLGELADKLSDAGVGLSTVRSLLASNPTRFAYHERRWIPAARMDSQGRPFAEAMRIVLDRYQAPMSLSALAGEITRVRRSSLDVVEPIVRRTAERDAAFVVCESRQLIALARWSFEATDETSDRALELNGVTTEELAEVQLKLADFDWRAPDAVAKAVRLTCPVKLRVLGGAAYSALNSPDPRGTLLFDSAEFYTRIMELDGYVFAPDGTLHPAADAKKWIVAATRLADRLAPTLDVEDSAPIEVRPEDVPRLVNRVLSNEQTTTSTRLLEEFYEITNVNKTFPDDMSNIMGTLKASDKIQWVGGDRFRKKGDFPDYILEVPEPFQFVRSEVVNEDGDLVDVELSDEGLSSSLRKLLQHPLATDVLDEDVQPAPKTMPEVTRLVLKSIHRELGTFPMCQIPTDWLDAEPKIQELVIVDGHGRELQIWANLEDRLLYGFFDWWLEQQVESGAVFTLTKTTRPNLLEFEWLDQPDPVVFISAQRMEELRQLGVAGEDKSALALLIEVMAHWPKGADYLTILAELNVVRRSTRRLIASLLSSYQCFYQRSGSPVWHFDPKKVDLGFDKTKRKFVRK